MKLADFGTARIKTRLEGVTTLSPNAHARAPAGTPYFQAPEVQLGEQAAQPYSDVWTCCLVEVEWFTGKPAWKQTARTQVSS